MLCCIKNMVRTYFVIFQRDLNMCEVMLTGLVEFFYLFELTAEDVTLKKLIYHNIFIYS